MPYIDLVQLRVRRLKLKTFYCAACGCERDGVDRRCVEQESVVWLNERTPGILPVRGPICITCGWTHYHKAVKSKTTRAAVFQADNHECVYCGRRDALSIEHLTPQSRGGTHEYENLATACLPCNRRRQSGRVDMTPRFGRYRDQS
jgi:5-methylcytosine-specific restriction endonuclease McrA